MLVYCCLNVVTGKVYVGKTSGSIERRWAQHLSSARNGSPLLFHRAIRKYGPAAFRVRVVDTTRTEADLNRLEIQTIADMGALVPGGYNLRTGGDGGAHSQATRVILRQKALGRRLTPEHRAAISKGITGPQNGFFGKTHSEATKQVLREKCADVTRGIPKTPDHRAAISKGLTGIVRSEAHRTHMSQALMGRTLSEDHKAHIGQAGRGKPKPEGFGAKIAAARAGTKVSEETRERMRTAAQLREARKRGETP